MEFYSGEETFFKVSLDIVCASLLKRFCQNFLTDGSVEMAGHTVTKGPSNRRHNRDFSKESCTAYSSSTCVRFTAVQ